MVENAENGLGLNGDCYWRGGWRGVAHCSRSERTREVEEVVAHLCTSVDDEGGKGKGKRKGGTSGAGHVFAVVVIRSLLARKTDGDAISLGTIFEIVPLQTFSYRYASRASTFLFVAGKTT